MSKKTSKSGKRFPVHKDLPLIPFESAKAFRNWLSANHELPDGIWLKFAKRSTGIPSITYEEARDEALCFGWIDGLKNALDETYYTVRFTPRRPRSKWSKINRDVVERLIETKKMRAPGLAQVRAAQADGRWAAAYDSATTIQIHEDLAAALARNKKAKAAFEAVSAANRFAILIQVAEAKKPETRARRIEKFLAMLCEGRVPHPGR